MGRNAKILDTTHLLALNNSGLSLRTIAKHFKCSHVTVRKTLLGLGQKPFDTRTRSVESIVTKLPLGQQEQLLEMLATGLDMRIYLQTLITRDLAKRKANAHG